jgi:mono/diheme cytochrome c family protein
MRFLLFQAGLVAALFHIGMARSEAALEPVDFNRDIQPLLSENCYLCHGPDAKAREADLRLDRKEGIFGKTEDGLTIVQPGNAAGSELILRITSKDRDEVMPPPKSHRHLSPAQIALIQRWVQEGATWAQHWAFIAPRRPAVPDVPGATIRNPIDAFIAQRLRHENLGLSPEAPKEKLLRRVTLDLTGLPPTVAEIDAFLADNSPDAFEKVVDRLLASPRYGERMAWEWLEAARYADTNGYQGDPTRPMWFWRDWAIRALNANMPFDQFTIEQLAGDLLPNPTRDQLIATGFHRNHMINGEGGRIAEESRVDYVQDRVETTGTVWMGLTLNCCRCHDHKFDPIAQREYYQLSAYFNSIDESGAPDGGGGLAKPTLALATPEQEKRIAELKKDEEEARQERDALEQKVRTKQFEWEQAARTALAQAGGPQPKWVTLVPEKAVAESGATITKNEDGSLIVSGPNAKRDTFVLTVRTDLAAITGFKLEALPDPAFANNGAGRADNGNFVLSEIKLEHAGKAIRLGGISADFEQGKDHRAVTSFDGNPETGWAVMPEFGKVHTLIFEPLDAPLVADSGHALLSFRLECRSGHVSHVLGKFRLSATTADPMLLRALPEKIAAALALPNEQRSDAQKKEVSEYYLANDRVLVAANQKRDELKRRREKAEQTITSTMVMRDRAKPRETFILIKGAYDKFGEKVTHGVPAVLPRLSADAPPNRLALARWLVSPEHPLTARVTVNRFWQLFFGTGLVKTVADFGLQGEKPSHPQLLDWLAREFVESGWDVKRMHRLIVTSATYRQSSAVTDAMTEHDPDNRLLSRAPRFRLSSWMLRDQALAVAGLLVEKLGGPPVKTYQPDGVWEDATFGQIRYTQDHGDALYRRSLYVFWRRIIGPTIFFDVANRQNCAVNVGRTNTPLHALVTLNDVTYVEAARALAERMLKAGSTDAARLAWAFRNCTARLPQAHELEILQRALGRMRQSYRADADAAKKLISAGESKYDAHLDPAELAAHTAVASLLLNMDETLCRE